MNKESCRYDFLIVGAGLYGASAARVLADKGYRVLVVEKRGHIGGNAYTEMREGICVHMYGAHIFHTDSDRVWEFINRFAGFNNYIHMPAANWNGELYSLPFNMNTFREMWGVTEAAEAAAIIERQIRNAGLSGSEPANLEEQAIALVGTDLYEKLIKGYTEKQWGRPCRELPASIIRRIPVRFEYNNNYFKDRYQGIPECGYTEMVSAMLEGIEVRTETDFLDPGIREELSLLADRIIYTGQIDAYYDYCFGPLEYRGLRFETETLDMSRGTAGRYFQDRAVVNYTDSHTPWTRIIEHRHFTEDPCAAGRGLQCSNEDRIPEVSVITREYPSDWVPGDEAFYPVPDHDNRSRYERYLTLASKDEKIIFGGRLGSYSYYDMDDAIEAALIMTDGFSGRKD